MRNDGEVIHVFLGEDDLKRAMEVAQRRFDFYGGDNYRGAEFQDEKFDLALHRIGAASELATARALRIEWTGDITRDVGPYEIKAVRRPRQCGEGDGDFNGLRPAGGAGDGHRTGAGR